MDDYQNKLDESLATVEEEIKRIKELTKPISPDNAIGRLSRMEAINEKSINEASLRNLEAKRSLLIQAIKRLKDGDYGECLQCGEMISEKRLKVVPEATLCLPCANNKQEG